jgi:hypothetical protein
MFQLIAINFSQKSPHFSLLSPTSPCELSEREVTSPSNLKVVRALTPYVSHIHKFFHKSGLSFPNRLENHDIGEELLTVDTSIWTTAS